MKCWSLKVKVGAYSALLTVTALAVTALFIMRMVSYQQVRQLDGLLENDAEELYRDLKNFRGAPVDPRRPMSERFIPVALLDRYLTLRGPEGQILYRSPNLRDAELEVAATGIRTVTLLGNKCRIGTFEKGAYHIQIGTDMGSIERFQGDLQRAILAGLPITGLVVFLGGIWLGRRAVAPVESLTAAAERISAEHPDERLPIPLAGDELARLTEVINAGFDRMQVSYDAARRFSADASHQLKTPISVLRVGLGELRECGYLKAEEMEEVQGLMQQTRRLSTLVDDLLLLAQLDAGRLKLESEPLDLAALAASARDDLEALTEGRGVTVDSDFPDLLMALGDRRRVMLVLQNMMENSVKYTPEGGHVYLSGGSRDGLVWLRCGNSGDGIPMDEQARIFERFFRGSAVGEEVSGQGLGLNISRELARAQGGEFELVASADGWTEFELRLPACDSDCQKSSPRQHLT